jgi:hypothetical protein
MTIAEIVHAVPLAVLSLIEGACGGGVRSAAGATRGRLCSSAVVVLSPSLSIGV